MYPTRDIEQGQPRVEFFDHLLLQVARKAGHLPVGTLDRPFAKLAGVDRV